MLDLIVEVVTKFVSFGSDLVTVLLGSITLYGLYKFRSRIGLFIKNIRLNHLDERAGDIKKTLDQIESVEFGTSTSTQLRGLFGKLNGQLIPLKDFAPELAEIQSQINVMLHEKGRLNEAIKQQLIYHVRGQLQNTKLNGLEDVTKENGP